MGRQSGSGAAARAGFATVTSLVVRRIERQIAVGQLVEPPRGELGDEVTPDRNRSGTDTQCPSQLGLGSKVSDGSVFAHDAKLNMLSVKMQSSLVGQSLSLLYMRNQRWKSCKTRGERLAWAIEHAEITQAELSRKLKISTAAVTLWFSDKTKNPKIEHFFKTAEVCGVNVWWLAIGEGSPYDDINTAFDGISGQDLVIAKDLSNLADKSLRSTVEQLIRARRAEQEEQTAVKNKA